MSVPAEVTLVGRVALIRPTNPSIRVTGCYRVALIAVLDSVPLSLDVGASFSVEAHPHPTLSIGTSFSLRPGAPLRLSVGTSLRVNEPLMLDVGVSFSALDLGRPLNCIVSPPTVPPVAEGSGGGGEERSDKITNMGF